jgi:hypothetical protein
MKAMPEFRSGRVVRETGRVIAQAQEKQGDDEAVTTSEITDRMAVRVREAPWERSDPESGRTADVTSLVVFVMTATMFTHRLYGPLGVEACHYRVGLASPAGVRLALDRRGFRGFSNAYVATSRTDIWIDRQLNVRDLATAEERQTVTFGVLGELFDYFGWRAKEESLISQIKHIANHGGISDS